MDKQEFLNQMIAYGENLLKKEEEEDILKYEEKMDELCEHLAYAAAALEHLLEDKKSIKAHKIVQLIMKAQHATNVLADEF